MHRPLTENAIAVCLSLAAFLSLSACGAPAAYVEPKEAAEFRRDTATALDRLSGDVGRLSGDVAALKTPRTDAWSCAARCVTKYHCNNNGDNNVTWTDIRSKGATANDTFMDLNHQCHDGPLVQARCTDGKFISEDATIVNACVRE